jgi:D-alanyl-D-alanine carboxypeptidase
MSQQFAHRYDGKRGSQRRITKALGAITAAGSLMVVGAATAFASDGPAGQAAQVASNAPTASVPSERSVQQSLDQLVKAGLPGAVALVRNGDHLTTAAAGYADLVTHERMTTRDHVRIGSNTKVFTATMMLQLVGEHRLRLDDTVEHVLPGTIRNGSDITVRQLLNHTSGLFDYENDPRFAAPYETDPAYYWAPRALVALADSHARLFSPGTKWSYSNTNYMLLGLMIEKLTHHSYTHELERRIIEPLKLHNTQFPVRSTAIESPYAHGYELNQPGGPLDITHYSPSTAWAAGALTSTVSDLARFDKALLMGKLLSPARLAEMKQTVPMNDAQDPSKRYGLGLTEENLCGTTMWGHTGTLLGFQTNAFTSSDGKIQILLATNSDSLSWNTDQVKSWLSVFRDRLCPAPAK